MAISHYTPLPGESFSSTNFMLPIIALPSLGSLRVNNVSLLSSPSTLAATLPLTPEGEGIEFSQIRDFKPIADMLDLLPNNVNILLTRCAMGHPRGPFNLGRRLILRDIEADEDLIPLLRCWEGDVLTVDNCPSFNDAVLDMMATVVDEEYVCAPWMVELDIADCPNFSAAALRCLVGARFHVHDGDAYPGINKVYISGLAPNFSTEDQKQISRHVYQFNYYPSSF
jgi:hypothetical protein